MKNIGVLALQGAISEHVEMIRKTGNSPVTVKKPEQLNELAGLIIPGGESTAIRKLILRYGFMEPLKAFHKAGKGIFGTCAGMVLSATAIEGGEESLGFSHYTAMRNGFGRQKDSFEADLAIDALGKEPFRAVFIRAPYLLEPAKEVEVLAYVDDKIVAAREGNVLVTAFHPELTEDERLMQYFVDVCCEGI